MECKWCLVVLLYDMEERNIENFRRQNDSAKVLNGNNDDDPHLPLSLCSAFPRFFKKMFNWGNLKLPSSSICGAITIPFFCLCGAVHL